ncbi:lipase family protein [Georgenia alba]|uniref:Lipase family protein n=1 Tax=Georgenia alba TaxID=2233858 RepID=A0ABW2Q3Q9_9MICO
MTVTDVWQRCKRIVLLLAMGSLLGTVGMTGALAEGHRDGGRGHGHGHGGPSLGHVEEGPEGSSFWDTVPNEVEEGSEPGDIYWVQPRDDAPRGARGWNVIYVSEIAEGQLAYVSGEIYVPNARRGGEVPVVLWNHETAGNADACAPSRRDHGSADFPRVPALGELLEDGYAVVASDYPGLGLAGPAYYMAGEPNARASLDVVRAARSLPRLRLGDEVSMYGWSQGGQTTLWATQIARTYAPELDIRGSAMIGPATHIRDLTARSMTYDEFAGYVISTLPGIKAAYPELDYADFLTVEGLTEFPSMAAGCWDIWSTGADLTDPYQPDAMAEGGPWWNAMTDAQDFDYATMSDVPFVVFQGLEDTTTPPEMTVRTRDDMCAAGVSVDYREMPGRDHGSGVPVAAEQLPGWFADRFDGAPAESTCS